jgi:hypothetical protein
LLTIGGTIQQIIEHLQLAADERLIEPLWRMQVLVDRASRAQTDEEMDRYDDQLLKALGEFRTLRDRLSEGAASGSTQIASDEVPGAEHTSAPSATAVVDSRGLVPVMVSQMDDEGGESDPDEEGEDQRVAVPMPNHRYNHRRLDDRLAATR